MIEILDTKKKYPRVYTVLSFLPGFFSLFLVLLILLGYSLFVLEVTSSYSALMIFISWVILIYYLRWVIRGMEYVIFVFLAIFKLLGYQMIRFRHILFGGTLTLQEKLFSRQMPQDLSANEIIHRAIIPTYKEEISILDDTLHHLQTTDYDLKRLAITLAGEENDKENFLNIAQQLKKKYEKVFAFFAFTVHPKNVPGELQGKGANISYAAHQHYREILKLFDAKPHQVLVTTLDADTNVEKNYFNVLTYTYLITPDRKFKSYQPLIFFYNNFRKSPFFSKIVSLFNSFWIIFNFVKKQGTRNFSTHAQSLDALIETKFWSTQTIVEDGHQYRRSYFTFNGKYESVPLYTKVFQDCNQNKNLFLTAKAQYNQMRRRAHGAEDIPFVMAQIIERRHHISLWKALYEFFRLFEGVVLRSTLHVVLFIGMLFTLFKDISLSGSFNLGAVVAFFIKLSFVNMMLFMLLQLIFSPWHKIKSFSQKIWELISFMTMYLIFVIPVFVLFSGLPALHTQIALMIGKPMKKFNVTEKIRRG